MVHDFDLGDPRYDPKSDLLRFLMWFTRHYSKRDVLNKLFVIKWLRHENDPKQIPHSGISCPIEDLAYSLGKANIVAGKLITFWEVAEVLKVVQNNDSVLPTYKINWVKVTEIYGNGYFKPCV